jgi:hypothetical protein
MFKIKVIRLETSSSILSSNYSTSIEKAVNQNPKLVFDSEEYLLKDFKVVTIEEKSYVILRYER